MSRETTRWVTFKTDKYEEIPDMFLELAEFVSELTPYERSCIQKVSYQVESDRDYGDEFLLTLELFVKHEDLTNVLAV